jgi:hypothetical protein
MAQPSSQALRMKIQMLAQPEVYMFMKTRTDGLSRAEVEDRQAHHGRNVISEIKEALRYFLWVTFR